MSAYHKEASHSLGAAGNPGVASLLDSLPALGPEESTKYVPTMAKIGRMSSSEELPRTGITLASFLQ
jgi:hypothetical protein